MTKINSINKPKNKWIKYSPIIIIYYKSLISKINSDYLYKYITNILQI